MCSIPACRRPGWRAAIPAFCSAPTRKAGICSAPFSTARASRSIVGLLAVAIQAAIGIPLGLLAGYVGGRADTIVTRAADIQLSLSTLMLAIIVLALFRAGLGGESLSRFAVPLLVLVIGLAEWPYFARTARAATQVEAAKDYVRAARALGASSAGIMWRHILPNIRSPLIVIATTQVAGAIMAEAALSFLGLGMPVTKPSLGTLIRSGYDLIFAGAWWITVIPGPGADCRSDLRQCARRYFARCAGSKRDGPLNQNRSWLWLSP